MNPFPIKILLATDGSEEATLAAQIAAEMVDKIGSELHIVHVRPRIAPHYPGYYVGPEVVENAQQREQEQLDRQAQRLLDTQVERVRAAGGSVAQAHLRIGRSAEEIVALAEELGADLIVIGSRGRRGIRRALMGSVSDSIVRHAHCSVLVVRKEQREEVMSVFPAKILLATDGSEEATLAARAAIDIADETGSELHVVHVGPSADYTGTGEPLVTDIFAESKEELEKINENLQRLLDAQVKQIRAARGTVEQAHLKTGRPDEEIVGLAEEIGAYLIVVGSRGLSPIKRALMGSVSDSVVRYAHCPVLVVRKEKTISSRAADFRHGLRL